MIERNQPQIAEAASIQEILFYFDSLKSVMKSFILIIVSLCVCLSAYSQYNKEITIEPLLKTDTTSIGQKFHYPQFKEDEVTILKITIPPGESTGWHKHEFPVFAYVLKGDMTVDLERGKPLLFPENSTFSEVIGIYHNGVNRGDKDVVLLAFYLGAKGEKLSETKPIK